jgi:hypothetical protein
MEARASSDLSFIGINRNYSETSKECIQFLKEYWYFLFLLLLFLIFLNHGPVKCNKGKDPTENKLYLKLLWVIPGC